MDGQNIDLGTFSWDISKLEQEIIKNRHEMEAYSATLAINKKALKDEQKQMLELAAQIKIMQGVQKTANDMVKAGTISEAEYAETMSKSNQVIAENEAAIKDTAAAQSAHIKTIIDQENAVKALRKENFELNKLFEAGRQNVEGNETAYRDLNKELNALKLESKNLGAEMVNLKRDGKENTDEYRALEAQWKKVSAEADSLNQDFKDLDKVVGDNQRSVGDYKDQIVGAFSEIGTGFSQIKNGDIAGGFETIRGSVAGVTGNLKQMALALVTNPLTIFLAALTGVAYGFKQILDYNIEQLPKMRLIQNAFGDMGEEADILRTKINGVEETYGVAFDRILNTVDSISSSGLSTEVEAIDAIKKGLDTAPNADEFLSKLDAAASKARQTGISLEEVLNLTKALQGTAIDPGTIYGGIEKASNRLQQGLKENTELVSAFGETFAKDILGKVQSGQITTVQALEQVRLKGEEVNISVSQQAALGKSLFGKLAANAGAYTETLRLVGEAYKDQFADLTDLQLITKELSDNNEELAVAKDKALKSDSLLALKEEFSIFWKQIQIGFFNFLAGLRKVDKAVLGSSRYMEGLFRSIPGAAVAAFGAVLSAFGELLKGIGAGGGAFTKFFKGDIDGAKAEADKFINALPNFFKKIQTVGKSFGANISAGGSAKKAAFDKAYDLRETGLAEVNRQNEAKEAAASKVDDPESKKAKDKKVKAAKPDPAIKKALADAAKQELDIARQTADQKTEIAKLELAEYIRINASKVDADKRLSADRVAEQIKYLDEVKRIQAEINEQERQGKEIAIQQKIDEITAKGNLSANDLEQVALLRTDISNLNREFAGKDEELTVQTEEKKKEIAKTYAAQTAEDKKLADSIAFQSKLVQLEEEGASEYEIRSAMLEEQKAVDLEKLDEDRANALISQENYEAQKTLIEQTAAAESKQITKDVDDFKIQSRSQVLGGLADLFGKESGLGKIFAAAEIANNTVQQSSKAFAQAALFAANPLTAALAPNAYIQGGIIIASGAAQLAKLVAPKKGFSGGGYTGAGGVNEEAGIVHKGEVVWSQRDVAAVGGARVADAMRPSFAGYAMGGIVGSSMPGVQRSVSAKNSPLMIDKNALSLIADAIYAGSQEGIGDMADNRSIRQAANF